ncbi:histidine ammonia-lyase [Athalassotoga saccharophila]|uniref:histidine ammonia-lyase n=1 Tax=Athalassotoga saccharophila TaxID=1441386 RepID=UPI00137AD671|nr:histidine ammonia-lyase [Athalassotoga saccharophila]BBJ27882.1 histidine ammonia-lyase [Athalassotoga saccharophila]
MNYVIEDRITLEDVVKVAKGEKVEISQKAVERINNSRRKVEKLLSSDKAMYGINTGFGALATVKISKEEIDDLQSNLVRSHSVGVGPILDEESTRAMMLLRAFSLSRGYSGVKIETVNQIIEFLNRGVTPVVPSQGSVGSSGDLAPLAHVALAMMGEGDVIYHGKVMDASKVLEIEGLKPLKYSAKEGLALTNGTQAMTAILALVLYDSKVLFENSLITASISIDALKGSTTPFDPRIHELRPYEGQRYVASRIMEYLAGSEIRASHINCSKVQDAYSLRAIPQVLGAVKDTLDYVERQLDIEMNAVTDNPLVFEDEVLSGGNFHGEPMAFAADFLGIALSELGNITERRIDRLVNPLVSGLPPFLADGKAGLNSGLMMWQYTAASLVSENKVLSHPASVDSIPTSAYQEDHVSMGTIAAVKSRKIFENVSKIIAIEAMIASKGVRYHLPLRTGKKIEPLVDLINSKVKYSQRDHYMGKEFEEILIMVKNENMRGMIE